MKETNQQNDESQPSYHLIIPSDILKFFEVSDVKEREEDITITLIEKADNLPINSTGKALVLNGYMNPLELLHYPIQGKSFYLHLIRRRWKEQGSDGKPSYFNEYDFAAEGTKSTKTFGAFLKENL